MNTAILAQADALEPVLNFFGASPADARAMAVQLASVWILSLSAWWLVGVMAKRIVAMADDGDDTILSHSEKRAGTVAGLLRGAGRAIVLFVALILTLDVFMEIGPILAGAGVLGLAVSFGAQSLVKDVIAGFFIILENQFDVGDVIEAGGLSGGVENMTLRVVMLRDIHGTLHIIPNGQITAVSNKTRGWSRSVLDIGIDYGANVDQAIQVIEDEVKMFASDGKWRAMLDGPPEVKGVQSLGDSAVSIRVMIRTKPGYQWDVGREFMRRAKLRLDSEGIEIPFPQRTVHVRHHGPGANDAFGVQGS